MQESAGTANSEYDPHIHRQVRHPTTNFETLIHLLKCSLGTGILAMPQAVSNAGYIVGSVGSILLGFILMYCIHILVNCQYILCQRLRIPVLSYSMSMKVALESGPACLRKFGNPSFVIVDVFLIVYQMGIGCVYIVFVASNVKQITDAKLIVLDLRIHMAILLLPLLLIICIRNLKALTPFSTVANFLTFVGLGIILYYIFIDFPGISERNAFVDIKRLPLFFGTVLFALEAVAVILELENNMKTPKSFGGYFGVLNIGMFTVALLYAIIGTLGYLKYGENALGSITLNIPEDELLSQITKAMFSIAIFISYSLHCYVPVEIVFKTYIVPRLREDSPHRLKAEYGVRFSIVLITFLAALAVPRLGLFISLFGAFCLSALGIIFPALIEICVKYPDELGCGNYILYKDIVLIIFGFTGLIAGTYTSIYEMIKI